MKNLIASIEPIPRKKGIYRLKLDDGHTYPVHEEIIAKYGLKSGMSIDAKELSQRIFEADSKRAFDLALNYLGYRHRSRKELTEYLIRKGFDENIVDLVIVKLEGYKFIDDADFARRWVENKKNSKPAGKKLIAYELKLKGIDNYIVENAISTISETEELENAILLGRRYLRKYKELPEHELKAKIGQALIRRGFDWDTIKSAVERIVNHNEDFFI